MFQGVGWLMGMHGVGGGGARGRRRYSKGSAGVVQGVGGDSVMGRR
jgi:hypothetical protein